MKEPARLRARSLASRLLFCMRGFWGMSAKDCNLADLKLILAGFWTHERSSCFMAGLVCLDDSWYVLLLPERKS